MVRKQNERTILLQSRIIPLSLHPIFHILAPRPLSTRLGAFSSPKHFPTNFSRNFFQSCQGDFFLYFWCEKLCFLGANFFLLLWCEKLWGWKTFVAPQIGGGVSSFIPALCPPLWSPLYLSSIQKATNLNIFWYGLVFCRENLRLRREKTKQIFSFGVVLCSVTAFFVLLLSLLSYWYGWLCCVFRPPSEQK